MPVPREPPRQPGPSARSPRVAAAGNPRPPRAAAPTPGRRHRHRGERAPIPARQGRTGGARRADGTALRAPAPSQPLTARPGAPTYLCAPRGGSDASPSAPYRPPGETTEGGGGRRAQQGQGEQQPPLAGGCGRQAPRCPQHRHLARAGAQGIVGRRRTRGWGGAGRGGSGRPEGRLARTCPQSRPGGTARGAPSDPSWRAESGCPGPPSGIL